MKLNIKDYKNANAYYENELELYHLSKFIHHLIPCNRSIVIVCIGTDRSTGDSLGPLTGMMLSQKNLVNVIVYGTLSSPVHAVNLKDVMRKIYKSFDNPFVIGVDSCLGDKANIGMIYADNEPINPGAALNKKLPIVGDISLSGVVNAANYLESIVLQNTRLNLVMNMAKAISECLTTALQIQVVSKVF
ncbi:spore protease YyaC [Sporolactobacillus sp. Y61]|uniref:Spore protease YyaC n=1 Tax=Sporolactobacillus sp. Y61 TaxID=3160863 RepID=A0AAU8IGA5_9BACL